MSTADTLQELRVAVRRGPISWLDVRVAVLDWFARMRRLSDDPASWRLGARTPASWTLAAAFAVASAGAGLAWPGADVLSDPGGRGPAGESGLALPGNIAWPDDDPFLALKAPAEPGPAPAPPAATVEPVRTPDRTIPVGKGMWLHTFDSANGGDARSIVAQSLEHGITHLYVRTGSSRMGFYAQPDLNRILPVAHAAGIKVVGWDFPYLKDWWGDADRAHQAITYKTPDGHQIDAFSADIETASEGTNLTTEGARSYGIRLRQLAGDGYPLIATVPRPNPKRWYPYPEVVHNFDAIAPMVYWINRDPVTDLAGAIEYLKPFGKPILPVGQAYDPGIDGSHQWGPPSKQQIEAFVHVASLNGVPSVSFWAWNTATGEHWQAIREAKVFDLDNVAPDGTPTSIAKLQRLLVRVGYDITVDGVFGPVTAAALSDYQTRSGLPVTGSLDEATIKSLTKKKR